MKIGKSLLCISVLAFVIIASFGTNKIKANTNGSFGLRVGYDFDFEQVFVGGQAEMGKVLKILRFAPSVDYGFGNDLTTFAFNPDFRIYFSPPGAAPVFYGGAGPTFLVASPDGGDSNSELGLTLSGGIKFGEGKGRIYNLEGRFGFEEMPDFRLLMGIFF